MSDHNEKNQALSPPPDEELPHSPTKSGFSLTELSLAEIRTDGMTQSRAGLNSEVIKEYAERMQVGDSFPPVETYWDGTSHWLADGFHRYEASRLVGRTRLPARIFQGTRRDALLHGIRSNVSHGLRRTEKDKRKAVLLLLQDDEWSGKSNYEIAAFCAISPSFVRKIKNELRSLVNLEPEQEENKHRHYREVPPAVLQVVLEKLNTPSSVKTVQRGNQVFQMNTALIGKTSLTEKIKKLAPAIHGIASQPVQVQPHPAQPPAKPVVKIRQAAEVKENLLPEPVELALKIKQVYSVEAMTDLCVEILGSPNSSLYSLFLKKINAKVD